MNHKDQEPSSAGGPRRGAIAASADGSATASPKGPAVPRRAKLFDSSIIGTAQEAVDFVTNILESSTEYSVIAKDLAGNVVLWNEGARRLYGYEPDEVVGKANSAILHPREDVEAGVPGKSCRLHSN